MAIPVWPQGAANGAYGQLDADPALFAVMAAINAAGYDADIDSPTNHGLRKALRDHFEQEQLASVAPLRRFVQEHKKDNELDDLSQYISFALLSKGPPDFTPARADLPQPPDAAALEDLPPLLADFYQEANLASIWAQVEHYYEEEMERYTEPLSQAVLEVNAFLRNPTSGSTAGRFRVLIDLLGAPNQVQTRTYLDDYYVVVTPSPELRLDEIRHHYLHFVVDPLGFRFAADLTRVAPLADYALASPILQPQYRDDFTLLATECFIKALEARITRRPEMVEQAMSEGFVLTGAFFDQLDGYLDQDSSMEIYFPDLVNAIDLYAEAERLDKIEFTEQRQVRTIQVTRVVEPPKPTGAAGTLEEAEELYRDRNLEQAKTVYSSVLTETGEKPLQARAYYGLARIAVLERDPETGDQLFRKVLELEPDDSTRSWSLLYLGKLADSQGDLEPAQEFYRGALAVPGVPDQVRREAQQGLDGAFARPRN